MKSSLIFKRGLNPKSFAGWMWWFSPIKASMATFLEWHCPKIGYPMVQSQGWSSLSPLRNGQLRIYPNAWSDPAHPWLLVVKSHVHHVFPIENPSIVVGIPTFFGNELVAGSPKIQWSFTWCEFSRCYPINIYNCIPIINIVGTQYNDWAYVGI